MFVCFAGSPHFSTNVLSKAIAECVVPIRKNSYLVNNCTSYSEKPPRYNNSQNSIISFGNVDIQAKIFLILYSLLENSTTCIAIIPINKLVFNKWVQFFKARLFLTLELGTTKPIFYHDSLKPLTPPPGPKRMILSFVFYTNIMLDTRFCCCHQYVVATNLNYFIEKVMSPKILNFPYCERSP